jgi:hypothetical protein
VLTKWKRANTGMSLRGPTAAPQQPTLPAPDPTEATVPELDDREARFVVEYVIRSGTQGAGADAALAAGYSNGNRDAAHSQASRLLRRPKVLRAIRAEVGRRIAAAAPLGLAVLETLARSARSEQVRLAAARDLVDRGYGPVVSRNASTNVNVGTSLEEMLRVLDKKESEEAQRAGEVLGPMIEGAARSSVIGDGE